MLLSLRVKLLKKPSKGQSGIALIMGLAIVAILIVAVLPVFPVLYTDMSISKSLDYLRDRGYIAYASPQGILHVEGLEISGSPPITLTDDGKVWVEISPDLDFDIVKKNAVPVSYERGIFSGFELPIWSSDDQELFFDICIPDRWDEESIVHVHLDVFVIGAQDSGDAFKLQIAYEHYNGGVDVVPSTSTPIEVETSTGASAAFQSYHVHFDIPAGNMVADDILAFRVRRIAITEGTEIDGNVVFNHAGVLFQFDKIGSTTAD